MYSWRRKKEKMAKAKVEILIVENNVNIAEDISSALKGYNTIIAYSGEGAIKNIEDINPDLILMDIALKGNMNGIEAAKKIRNCFDIPIVYLTTHTNKEQLEWAEATEPFDYIVKPIDEKFLLAIVEIALME